MGGPFWEHKDEAAWSIPKGLYEDGEESLATALREFGEEVGVPAPPGEYELLGDFRQPSGKIVTVFVGESILPIEFGGSNLFDLEWPPNSGGIQQFPEMIDAQWVSADLARVKLVKGQRPIVDALAARLT